MAPATDPRWTVKAPTVISAVVAIVMITLSCGVVVWGKADKAEVDVIRERVYTKADQSQVDGLANRLSSAEIQAARADERYKAIENQLSRAQAQLDTANKQLSFLIENLVTGKKGGEASANQGSGSRRPGDSAPGERSSPTSPSFIGPNPLSGQ